jgi:hypothetical protein
MSEEETQANRPEDTGPTLEWRCHPMKRRPWVSVAVTLFIFLLAFMVYVLMESKFFTILALILLFASLAKFYFPTEFRLNREGVAVKTTTQTLHKEWSLFRSYYPDKNGVLLSPFVRPSRLESFRGLYLMFNNNRDEVVEFVKRYVGADAAEREDVLESSKERES